MQKSAKTLCLIFQHFNSVPRSQQHICQPCQVYGLLIRKEYCTFKSCTFQSADNFAMFLIRIRSDRYRFAGSASRAIRSGFGPDPYPYQLYVQFFLVCKIKVGCRSGSYRHQNYVDGSGAVSSLTGKMLTKNSKFSAYYFLKDKMT